MENRTRLSVQLEEHNMTVLHVGDLAYLDSFAGLIPCRVHGVTGSLPGNAAGFALGHVEVKLTAGRSGYARGEVIGVPPSDVIPRSHVRHRGGKLLIRSADRIEP